MGLVPHDQLVIDGAPFVAAFGTMFGSAAWAHRIAGKTQERVLHALDRLDRARMCACR